MGVKSSQVKSSQVKSSQVKSSQVKSSHLMRNMAKVPRPAYSTPEELMYMYMHMYVYSTPEELQSLQLALSRASTPVCCLLRETRSDEESREPARHKHMR